jgi:Arc/MetJ-type ribon-helix-helix transcriptional regulator
MAMSKGARARSTTRTAAHRAVSKISVSLPDDVTAEVKGRVGSGRVSADVTAAVERALVMDRLRDLVEDLDAEHGPVSVEALAAAEAA